jgi:hypothetical protein
MAQLIGAVLRALGSALVVMDNSKTADEGYDTKPLAASSTPLVPLAIFGWKIL